MEDMDEMKVLDSCEVAKFRKLRSFGDLSSGFSQSTGVVGDDAI